MSRYFIIETSNSTLIIKSRKYAKYIFSAQLIFKLKKFHNYIQLNVK